MAREQRRTARVRRHARVRAKVKGNPLKPRLCVFRSLNNVYAQVIDDTAGHTLATASTIDPDIRGELDGKAKTERSALVGTLIARRALSQGVTQVAFDRGGRKYHGRVKALAEAAREGGLKF